MSSDHDHELPAGEWPFSDPEHGAVICCSHVLEGMDILLVTHDAEDGCWQMLCGGEHLESDGRVDSLGDMVLRDGSLRELADLPLGWSAIRTERNAPWTRAIHRAR